METLTIFTPTFNRKSLLPIAYDALKKQTNKDFVWMIIDDGSTDETDKLVSSWINNADAGFVIEYYYKENGGLQTAYIEALKHIKTDLCMCVDSDDYLLEDAVERLLSFWKENGSSEYAGIVSLDMYPNGNIVGGKFPVELKTSNFNDIGSGKQGRTDNDIAMLYRTKAYEVTSPAKYYPGERSLNASRLFMQIAEYFDFLVLNEPTVVVNYQEDGLSGSKFKTYFRSPNSYADYRMFVLSNNRSLSFKESLRTATHYVTECIIAKRRIFVKDLCKKWAVLCAFFPGIAFYIWLKRNVGRTNALNYTLEVSGRK